MEQKQFSFDDICRYVGRLYLIQSQELERATSILQGQNEVLRGQLDLANEQIEQLRKNERR